MVASGTLFPGRVTSGAGVSAVHKRSRHKRHKPLTLRRALRICLCVVKLVVLVTWEVTKFAVSLTWQIFCFFFYVFLMFASFVLRSM